MNLPSDKRSAWRRKYLCTAVSLVLCFGGVQSVASGDDALLRGGVKAVWDMDKAYHETTPTSERISINGLWRWQPADDVGDTRPGRQLGILQGPGALVVQQPDSLSASDLERQEPEEMPTWPGTSGDITIPDAWQGRRIAVYAEYVNSYAAVYLDGKKLGDMYFPSGEVDITSACRPGKKQVLSLCVKAVPAGRGDAGLHRHQCAQDRQGVGGAPRTVRRRFPGEHAQGGPRRRGESEHLGPQVDHHSRRCLAGSAAGHVLTACGRRSTTRAGRSRISPATPFTAADVKDGRFSFTAAWKPDKLWDTITPQNMYGLEVSLVDRDGRVLDVFRPLRFGFREFWIEGRDFYLNGTRFHSFIVPIDNAQRGGVWPRTTPPAKPCSATSRSGSTRSTPTTTAARRVRT